jgi:hypothetical protein
MFWDQKRKNKTNKTKQKLQFVWTYENMVKF